MECPKCHRPQPEGGTECVSCGLIFARYRESPPEVTVLPASERGRFSRILDYMLFSRPSSTASAIYGRAALLLFLFAWSWWFWLDSADGGYAGRSFMHLVNLPFHEAGHVFTRPLGSFMTSLGGSLGQLLMPAVCLAVLLFRTRDSFGASVSLWWLGESFLDLSPYIGDAGSMTLPLLGGNTGRSAPYGFHDWNYILSEAGLLEHDHLLAVLARLTGTVFMALALVWGGAVLLRAWRSERGS